jgi:hypothetical protein
MRDSKRIDQYLKENKTPQKTPDRMEWLERVKRVVVVVCDSPSLH